MVIKFNVSASVWENPILFGCCCCLLSSFPNAMHFMAQFKFMYMQVAPLFVHFNFNLSSSFGKIERVRAKKYCKHHNIKKSTGTGIVHVF